MEKKKCIKINQTWQCSVPLRDGQASSQGCVLDHIFSHAKEHRLKEERLAAEAAAAEEQRLKEKQLRAEEDRLAAEAAAQEQRQKEEQAQAEEKRLVAEAAAKQDHIIDYIISIYLISHGIFKLGFENRERMEYHRVWEGAP